MSSLLVITALLLCGMLLLVAEVAIIPGFGVAGIAGVLMTLGAGVYAWHEHGAAWGIGSILLASVVTAAAIVIAPRTRAGKALVLSEDLAGAATGASEALVGLEGVAVSPLRPAGIAQIGDRRIEVESDGIFIEAGQHVRITAVDGSRVVVEPSPPSSKET